MQARRWYLTLVTLLLVVLSIILPLASTSSVTRGGDYAPHVTTIARLEQMRDGNDISDIAQQTRERLGPDYNIRQLDGKRLEITSVGDTQEQLDRQERLLTAAPTLTITNEHGNPLFRNGLYLVSSRKALLDPSVNIQDFRPPLAQMTASYRFDAQQNRHLIDLHARDTTSALEISRALANTHKKDENRAPMYVWLGIREYINQIRVSDPIGWEKADGNPVAYAELLGPPREQNEFEKFLSELMPGGQRLPTRDRMTRSSARTALIGTIASLESDGRGVLTIDGDYTGAQARTLAAQINYGSADYHLNIESSWISSPTIPFTWARAALPIIVLLSCLALIFIIRYRIIGLIATGLIATAGGAAFLLLSAASIGYSVVTLMMLIGSLVILTINTAYMIEQIREGVYHGITTERSAIAAARSTLLSWGDTNLILLVAALYLFYHRLTLYNEIGVTIILAQVATTLFGALSIRAVLLALTRNASPVLSVWLGTSIIPYYRQYKMWAANETMLEGGRAWVRLISNIMLVSLLIMLIVFLARGDVDKQTIYTLSGLEYAPHQLVITANSSRGPLVYSEVYQLEQAIHQSSINDRVWLHTELMSYNPISYRLVIRSYSPEAINECIAALPTQGVTAQITTLDTTYLRAELGEVAHTLGYILLIQIIYTLFRWRLTVTIAMLTGAIQYLIIATLPLAFGSIPIDQNVIIFLFLAWYIQLHHGILQINPFQRHLRSVIATNPNMVLLRRELTHISYRAARGTRGAHWILILLLISVTIAIAMADISPQATGATAGILIALVIISISLQSRILIGYTELQQRLRQDRIKANFWETQDPVEQTFPNINDFPY